MVTRNGWGQRGSQATGLRLATAGAVASLCSLSCDRAQPPAPSTAARDVAARPASAAPTVAQRKAESPEPTPAATAAPSPGDTSAMQKRWQQVLEAFQEAVPIASGSKGAYPFDRAGKERLLENLKLAQSNAKELLAAEFVSETSAALLDHDLRYLRQRVAHFRPTEMKGATCYRPSVRLPPEQASAKRLRARLPMLEKLALAERLRPAVVERILRNVEADIVLLEKPGPNAVSRANKKLAGEVRAQVAAIRSKLSNSG